MLLLSYHREALNKMKDVYEKSPQMGDPSSLQPKIAETMSNIEKLRMEIHKNEVSMTSQYLNVMGTFYPVLGESLRYYGWFL